MVNPTTEESAHQASVLYVTKVSILLLPHCVVRHTFISSAKKPRTRRGFGIINDCRLGFRCPNVVERLTNPLGNSLTPIVRME